MRTLNNPRIRGTSPIVPRVFYERLGFFRETQLRDFYAPGDDKVFYVKVL